MIELLQWQRAALDRWLLLLRLPTLIVTLVVVVVMVHHDGVFLSLTSVVCCRIDCDWSLMRSEEDAFEHELLLSQLEAIYRELVVGVRRSGDRQVVEVELHGFGDAIDQLEP